MTGAPSEASETSARIVEALPWTVAVVESSASGGRLKIFGS